MLFKVLDTLLDIEKKVNSNGMAGQKKMTSKERDRHEYDLWVMSEELKDDE